MINGLQTKARWVRQQVLEMIVSAGKGHIGGSLSCTDILVALYYGGILRYDSKIASWDGRDRFILSKGHSCAALYAILADTGFFPISKLASFCQEGSMLEGHPNRAISGIEADTGSLGHGLGIATGLALGAKMDNRDWLTVVLLSDGECQEGSTWEAVLFAAHHKLRNLVAIVDHNWQCSIDFTEDCNRLTPLDDKWQAFGWDTRQCEGHSFKELLDAFKDFRSRRAPRPLVIIANTIKGKGVSFMEGKIEWHHRVPAGEQLKVARQELAGD